MVPTSKKTVILSKKNNIKQQTTLIRHMSPNHEDLEIFLKNQVFFNSYLKE